MEAENGKGKEYHYNGKLEYEGGYLNGKRNGKGKEYDGDGNLIFESEFLNGKRIKKNIFDSCINIWIKIYQRFNYLIDFIKYLFI